MGAEYYKNAVDICINRSPTVTQPNFVNAGDEVKIMILDTIKGPEDIKRLTYPEMEQLASEIRSFLIEKISHNLFRYRLMVGQQTLTLLIGVRLPLPKPIS